MSDLEDTIRDISEIIFGGAMREERESVNSHNVILHGLNYKY